MAYFESTKKSTHGKRGSAKLVANGNAAASFTSDVKFFELEIAEVIDICLSADHPAFTALGGYGNGAIGQIGLRLINSSKGVKENIDYSKGLAGSTWARPLYGNIKIYPLLHEHVVVGEYISKYSSKASGIQKAFYYYGPLNIYGSVNANALHFRESRLGDENKEYSSTEDGVEKPNEKLYPPILGEFFSQSMKIKPLLPRAGDIIFEGRFGQSIRFSSSDGNVNPNIYIRAGQAKLEEQPKYLKPMNENINLDGAVIYMSVDETVPLIPSSTIRTAASDSATIPEEFLGKQIILTSDSIVLNSRDKTLVGLAKNGIGFSTGGDFTVDSVGSTTIASPVINLGFEAVEPVVLGNQLEEILMGLIGEIGKLIDEITKMSVTTGTGPSGPPINLPAILEVKNVGLRAIENRLESIKSKQNFTK